MADKTPSAEDAADIFLHRKRPGFSRRCLEGVAVTLCSSLGACLRPFQSQALSISKETTYITEPLKSDGRQVDYFLAIRQATCPENVATDDNGYRLMVRRLGPEPDMEPDYFARLCEQLGLDAGTLQPDMTCVDPEDFLRAYVESAVFDETLLDALGAEDRSKERLADTLVDKLRKPWSLDDLPMMARWLEDSDPALDWIGQAVRKPTFHIPMVRQHEQTGLAVIICCSTPMYFRSLARGLCARARFRIAKGDIDGAMDDIFACKRLGRHVGRGPSIIDLLVGMALEGIADHVGIAGSLEHPPTKEQLQRLIDELGSLPPEPEEKDTLLFERFYALDVIQASAQGTFAWKDDPFTAGSPARYLTALGVEWNAVAKRFNEVFDEVAATGGKAPNTSLTMARVLSFAFIGARSKYVADVLCNWLVPCSPGALMERRVCLKQMRHITLAMLMYERDHGTLPPAWSVDADGKPLHSWRVLLLPYLGHQALFERIRLDEPWDSGHNRQFHAEAMPAYRCPSDPAARPGQTSYSVVVGPDMPFEAGRGKRLSDFGPDSDDMVLLVERAEPAGWMDPTHEVRQSAAEEGIRDDEETAAPLPTTQGMKAFHMGHANFGLRNGIARPIWGEIDRKLLGKLLRGTNTALNIDD